MRPYTVCIAEGIELRDEAAERYRHARIYERRDHQGALRAATGVQGANELLDELSTIAATLRAEGRPPNRMERGRIQAILGTTKALAAELTGESEHRGLGFELRGAVGGGEGEQRLLGEWFAAETRTLAEGSGSGQYIVPPDYLGQVWDRLAAASVAFRAGFRVIETDSDTLLIPRLTADVTANWTAEGATITASDPTIDELTAAPKKLAAITEVTNELIEDSNPDVLDLLMTNHLRSIALKFDLGVFEGSGTPPEIRGLKNVSGISEVSMGTNGAALANLDPFADAIGLLAAENAVATAIIMAPRTWTALSKLKEAPSGNNKPLLVGEEVVDGIPRLSLYGVPVHLSSQLSVAEAQGTANNASSAYVVQADQVVIVRRREAHVEVDRSRLFHQDKAEVRTRARLDLVVPNPKAVVRVRGIIP